MKVRSRRRLNVILPQAMRAELRKMHISVEHDNLLLWNNIFWVVTKEKSEMDYLLSLAVIHVSV
jgi:hypothetical protein